MSLHYLWKHEPRNCVYSVMHDIRWDHPRRRIQMKFCVVAGLQEIVMRLEFHQNRLSGFGAVENRILFFRTDFTKPINTAISMRKGIFLPPTSPKPLNRVWRNSNLRTISWRPATVQNFISIRRRGWSQRIPSMTDKTQFRVHVSPGSAKTLGRRGGITNHYSIAYSQQHLCQKLPKSVDVSTKKRPPKHFLKSSKLANFARLQFNSMNMCLFSIKLPILVKICPTVIEILTFNKWSLKFTVYRSVFSCLRSMKLTDVSIDAIVALAKQKETNWYLVPKILF